MSTVFSASELLLRPIAFTRPLRLVEPTSWVPHIPFAFWLIEALRPRTVVELGTMSGNSFSAFAQAVQILGLEAACYAIDTWKGDPHTSFYGDDVFQEWSTFHDPHFGAFSRLVRSTFDDALTKFADGSIDLLHIDGYHTYEAVRHDFESWLPKLSASAVVLLHDTNVREMDFGVWKFWQDLSRDYPCFAFLHGHGLGVVAVGRNLPPDVRVLVDHVPHQSQDAFIVRQFFGTLGEALLRQPQQATQARIETELRSELTKIMEVLTSERERVAGWLTERDQALDGARVQISQLSAADEESRRVLSETTQALEDSRRQTLEREQQLQERLSLHEATVNRQEAELARANAERRRLERALQSQQKELHLETEQLLRRHDATIKGQEAELARLDAERHRLKGALQRRGKELHQVRAGIDQYRAVVTKLEQDIARWFKLVMRLRASRTYRASRLLRASVELARELARRAKFWSPPPAEATPMLAYMRRSTRRTAREIHRSGLFDDQFYMRSYPQVVEAGRSPLMHFVISGARKGRQPHPLFDVQWYLEQAATPKAATNPLRHYLEKGVRKRKSPHRLFDVSFYLAQNPDVAAAGREPLAHYLAVGASKRSNPHPLFNTAFYLERNPDVAAAGMNPLRHYLAFGGSEGRDPHPLFRSAFYLDADPRLRASGENPLVHFLRVGAAEGRAAGPTSLFDAKWYLEQAATSKAQSNPLLHYLENGVRKRRSPNRLFDVSFYLAHNQDVAAAGGEPLAHYLTVGAAKGSNPHPLFDTVFYLEKNPDVAAAGMNPLEHYLAFGGLEGRDPHPLFHSAFYLDQNPDVRTAKVNPLVHFLRMGAHEGRDPNPWFDTSFYLDANPRLRASGKNPLVHFLRAGAAEGRAAGPDFDTAYYVQAHPDVAASGLNPLTHFVLVGRAAGWRSCALPSPGTSAAEDIQRSLEAYETLVRRAREVEASRIAELVVSPPAIIRLSPQGDLSSHTRDVVLRAEESPDVSIVIPVFNNVRLTLECLLSIVEGTEEVPFEVIVVDNGSTDATKELLATIPNLKYLRNEENTGFGPACNRGGEAACGRYLVFLNNDAQVKGACLQTLLRTFSEFERVGAVGPKVLFPDGRLQDAGSAVNADCTTSLIGVFDDPDLPRFNYPREVEYVSGVCLMIEAERFRELGGFDDDFAPAYCEDVDLCLQLRQRGLRIVYQPSATVVHHLSVTSNALDPSFKVAAITRNQQKLSNRHQAQIDDLARSRVIAFYLPQFHPIPENDVWWGKGFTEWRNVTRARPNFEGHVQPRLPADLGFYDLRLRETYLGQVALAERYGVHGFCFYYYWFDGKRLLERPLERLLENESPGFPFCVCWANENWTRRWDGKEHDVLMAQSYGEEDDVSVIEDLSRYLRHPSYIRIGDRPLLLVYHAARFPDMRRTAETWRTECRSRGIGEIYLAMVQSFELSLARVTPDDWGFDAAVEFPPHHGGASPLEPDRVLNPRFKGHVYDYSGTALHYMTKTPPGYRLFRTVMPGWDNTARRQDDSHIFSGSTPGAYQAWLECALRQTREQNVGDERLVFINAWNEWAESAYLEPDLTWGHGYLEATRNALDNQRVSPSGHR
jgi:GT2 family glycosyltransferase